MQMGCRFFFFFFGLRHVVVDLLNAQILRNVGIWDKKVREYAYLLGWCGCGCTYKFYTGTTGGDVFIFTYLVLKEDEGQHGYSDAW